MTFSKLPPALNPLYQYTPFREERISIFLILPFLQSMLFSRGFLFRGLDVLCKFSTWPNIKINASLGKFIYIIRSHCSFTLTCFEIQAAPYHRAWLFPGNVLNFIMVKTIIATIKPTTGLKKSPSAPADCQYYLCFNGLIIIAVLIELKCAFYPGYISLCDLPPW